MFKINLKTPQNLGEARKELLSSVREARKRINKNFNLFIHIIKVFFLKKLELIISFFYICRTTINCMAMFLVVIDNSTFSNKIHIILVITRHKMVPN